eukprot:m51a1_g4331 Adaptor protein complex 1 (AP-1), gamma subunit (843) ;mRNA; r:139003-142008
MSQKLRDLIKQVRSCKTAAEERAIIAKECAAIRSTFNDDSANRHRNIAKLLYIHMLGYPTHFGQMECVKLIVSPYYSDKRIGYLGLMILLDETQEVLTLVTNTLQNDLNHTNQFIVGLSLAAVGNISSEGIARDLAPDVAKLMASPNSYIRKKAVLAAIRVVRKCPDLAEDFVPKAKAMFASEKNHGVLVGAVALATELCAMNAAAFVPQLVGVVPQLVRTLKTLVGTGYVPEHDVNGVTDPFLQVKILRLLRVLGTEQLRNGDAKVSEMMNDILAQVATNTESTRNVGNAVLYECVQTIVGIPSEPGLRVLAINVLGRFLVNRDNNIRYVSLNTLQKVVEADVQAVQRHRQTVVDCLKDADISIRRRALDLVYALVDESNVRQLVRDLLGYLVVADQQFRADIVAKLCWLVERFAPTKRWQFDTTMRVISIAGSTIPEEVPANLCAIVSQTADIQAYAVQRLYAALVRDMTQPALMIVGLWCIGEFADLLMGTLVNGGEEEGVQPEDRQTATASQIVDLLDAALRSPMGNLATQQHALTALVKLTTRTDDRAALGRARAILERYRDHINVDLQQRSCEFASMMSYESVRQDVLDRMPAPEEKPEEKPAASSGAASSSSSATAQPARSPAPAAPAQPRNVLDDILGGLTGGPATSPAAAAPTSPSAGVNLLDLLGGGPVAPAAAPAVTSPVDALFGGASKPANPLDAIFGDAPVGGAPAGAGGATQLSVYSSRGLTVTFSVRHPAPSKPDLYDVVATFRNDSQAAATDFVMRVAVPRWLKIQLETASSSVVPAGGAGTVTQAFHLQNTAHGQNPVILRVRVSCTLGGAPIDETTEISFPSTL